jgi:4-diphosphocytidyl-2-C-methyl-D-erythritol kinase
MLRARSHAKVNLHLEVVRRRDDGYHELRTIFQTIDLADEVELVPLAAPGEVRIEIEGAELPTDDRNLAVRAARELLRAAGPPGAGVAIRLRKRIPAGGGLGGGSSNAATVLLGLVRLFGLDPAPEELLRIARGLGADVPFFLHGGTALGTGRGDRIEPLPDPPAEALALLLVTPPFGMSTPEVFAALGAGTEPRPARGPLARPGAGREAVSLLDLVGENDLEEPALRLRPELGEVYTALESSGAIRIRLSGSGSTLYAVFGNPEAQLAAERALPSLLPSGYRTRAARTLGRAEWRAVSGLVPLQGG